MKSPQTPTLLARDYLPSLDGLRAVAVWLVMGRHIAGAFFPGEFGVTLFFFISGFIITRNLTETPFGPDRLLPFYLKRLFRLAPAVYVYLAMASLAVAWLGGELPASDLRATVLYYANYHQYMLENVRGVKFPLLEMTWSLAVEEHFYLLFPMILLFVRGDLRRLSKVLIWAIFACMLWRAWRWHVSHDEWANYTHSDTRLDSIAYGCLLATWLELAATDPRIAKWARLAASPAAVVGGLVVIAATLWAGPPSLRSTFFLTAQGFALMPLFCLMFGPPSRGGNRLNRALSLPFLNWSGRLSYSLYLYHVLALVICLRCRLSAGVTAAAAVALAYGAAWVSYSLIEGPGRRMGRTFLESLLSHRTT